MSRYRVDEPIPTSTTAHIYGPDGRVLGQIYRANDPESLRFKRFIEAHDEIIDALLDAAIELHEAGLSVRTNQIDTLIERINGKEAQ
jgi:hypothetical protein